MQLSIRLLYSCSVEVNFDFAFLLIFAKRKYDIHFIHVFEYIEVQQPKVHFINESTGDDDEYHVLQLIGCMTYLESGEEYGEVSDVINLPGQDLLAIKTQEGESLIPFVHQLVPEVDIKNKRIVVIPPTITGEMK